jgi:AMP-polyphosphate phosphotransferase
MAGRIAKMCALCKGPPARYTDDMTIDLSNLESGHKYDGDYDNDLAAVQERLAHIQYAHIVHNARSLIVFEGWDAAGKGGSISRMSAAWDPRYFQVYPIGAPTAEEKGKHFLWRFWNKLPAPKEISVLDRSHYGRVLVERVEGFASEPEWRRGYDEINEFEAQQTDIGTNIVKIFLHITQEEQDERLKERLETPHKRWKVTAEDFRNRDKRGAYLDAMHDMFAKTDTRWAPWAAFDGNNKKAARIGVLTHVADTLEAAVPTQWPDVPEDLAAMAKELGW